MASLGNTAFEFIYGLFGAGLDDLQLMRHLQYVFYALISTTIIMLFTPIIKYGKLTTGETDKEKVQTSSSWNFDISSRTTWMFCHMGEWVIPLVLFFGTPSEKIWSFSNAAALTGYVVHYFNRSVIYPSQISKNARPGKLHFVVLMALAGAYNGIFQSHHLLNVHSVETTSSSYIGFYLMLLGMYINKYHDELLTNLKKDNPVSINSTKQKGGYKIPVGGLFEYISCANYFGEILEWWGFALCTRGLPQLSFAIFSTVFLGTRAVCTHQFYKSTFQQSYPANRKILIPFLF